MRTHEKPAAGIYPGGRADRRRYCRRQYGATTNVTNSGTISGVMAAI
jgi:hypothetical protein